MKHRTLAHLLKDSRAHLIGRDRELALLRDCIGERGVPVIHVCGSFGIGKTALLDCFESWLADNAIPCFRISGAHVEPTPDGILAAFGDALGAPCESLRALTRRLTALDRDPVLIIDDVDALRLADTWLRHGLAPALPVGARLILAGRLTATAAWTREFCALFLPLPLGPLERSDVMAMPAMQGLAPALAERVHEVSGGHPLSLAMALQAARAGGLGLDCNPCTLVQSLLAASDDPRLRRMVEAASVVRRFTRELASAMLPAKDCEAYDSFLTLPFIHRDLEGAYVAEPVRAGMAGAVIAAEPQRYAVLHDAAAVWITGRLATANAAERWRYMADLLYLVPHATIRNAFFPPDAVLPTVEPAEPADLPSIRRIAAERLDAVECRIVNAWLNFLPHRFSVAREDAGAVVAFYVCARATDPLDEIAALDPLLRDWHRHLADHPAEGEVLFLRSMAPWASEHSAAWSACVLDVKRLYLERWNLARVYIAADGDMPQGPFLRRLGFRPLLKPSDGMPGGMALDLPGAGLIGWISTLVGVSLQIAVDPLRFVRDRRELLIAGRPVALTHLEAGVLAALNDRAPEIVSREQLIDGVWRRAFVGSNVVDAVIRTLRRKLGPESTRIIAVPKAGYRLSAPIAEPACR